MLTIESTFADANALGSSPLNLYPVPEDSEFEGFKSGFIDAPKIADIARRLIKACGEQFAHLNGVSIAYAWKRKGGVSKGLSNSGQSRKSAVLHPFWLMSSTSFSSGLAPTTYVRMSSRSVKLRRSSFTSCATRLSMMKKTR